MGRLVVRLTVDIGGLDSAFEQFEKRMTEEVAGEVEEIVTEVFDGMVGRTPVDEGVAVASYRASIDTPEIVQNAPVGPSSPNSSSLPLGGEPNRAAAEAIARASLNGLSFKDPYRVFWVSNGAGHINELEFGVASKRAPEGMARVTVAEVAARHK